MSPSLRSDDLIGAYREKYAAGEIELWEFEEAVDRALTGKCSAAEETLALAAAAQRLQRDEWFALAHEQRLRRLALAHEQKLRGLSS